jgi:Uma2 family endonuclease
MSAAERPRRLLTAEEYQRMADAGIIGAEERVELIEGEIYEMSPQKRPHIIATGLTRDLLVTVFGPGWIVLSQMTVPIGSHSLPEPDVCVVRGTWREYTLDTSATVALVVEVADTTLQFDRTTKAERYARAGIQECWIVNLVDRMLEVHRDPEPAAGTYRTITRHAEGDRVSPLAVPAASIAVADLLP